MEIIDQMEKLTVRNSNVKGTEFECVELSESTFKNVNMSRVLINDANLSDLEIFEAQLGGAYIHSIGLPPKWHPAYREDQGEQRPLRFEQCELAGTTITSCDLKNVQIKQCNIEGLTINGIDISALINRYHSEPEQTNQEPKKQEPSLTPLLNRTGAIFVPVRDIGKARDWYCGILGIPAQSAEIMNGHLCPLPMEGGGIILDTMPSWGGKEPGGPPTFQTPAFMFLTNDLAASYVFMKEHGAEIVTEIENDHWFAFRDPDGNLLMVCR
jgi:catechol 2,3-dioxygenase-like lactoylglutathione lyase family enzyme